MSSRIHTQKVIMSVLIRCPKEHQVRDANLSSFIGKCNDSATYCILYAVKYEFLMKNIGISILAAAALIISAATSCSQDDTIRYVNVTMGNVVDEHIVSDGGDIFYVTENPIKAELSEFDRVLLTCDILNKTPDAQSDNEYDIRLTDIQSVLTKAPVNSGEITEDSDIAVNDPVSFSQIWNAGGYLNMYIMILGKQNSKTAHLINLVYDEQESEEGVYVFELRHNAFGEVPEEGASDYKLGGSFVSFPIADIIEGNNATIRMKWRWYKEVGAGLSSEIEEHSTDYKWERTEFEQTPKTNMISMGSLR